MTTGLVGSEMCIRDSVHTLYTCLHCVYVCRCARVCVCVCVCVVCVCVCVCSVCVDFPRFRMAAQISVASYFGAGRIVVDCCFRLECNIMCQQHDHRAAATAALQQGHRSSCTFAPHCDRLASLRQRPNGRLWYDNYAEAARASRTKRLLSEKG